jgi:hypothetical protein
MVASSKRVGIGSLEWAYIAKNLIETFVKWPFMIMLLFESNIYSTSKQNRNIIIRFYAL